MNLHWPPLLLAALCAGAAFGTYRVQQVEWRTGDAYFFFWRRTDSSREHHPVSFRARMVAHWLFIAFMTAAAAVCFLEFVGLVQ
jgi:hypothetical protein